ncbi:MAG: helix-turn-helix domain-containing protein [Armatimonadota bacterium]
MVTTLREEIRHSLESRYDHRLHTVLLVSQGMACPEMANLLGDAPRTVEYWVQVFRDNGFAGLMEDAREGRPRRLSNEQRAEIGSIISQPPGNVGIESGLWTGTILSAFISRRL